MGKIEGPTSIWASHVITGVITNNFRDGAKTVLVCVGVWVCVCVCVHAVELFYGPFLVNEKKTCNNSVERRETTEV